MGGTTARQVIFSCVRKQAERAKRSKPVNSMPPWLLLQFLPWAPVLMCLHNGAWSESCKLQHTLSLSKLLLRFYHSIRIPKSSNNLVCNSWLHAYTNPSLHLFFDNFFVISIFFKFLRISHEDIIFNIIPTLPSHLTPRHDRDVTPFKFSTLCCLNKSCMLTITVDPSKQMKNFRLSINGCWGRKNRFSS